LLREQDTALLVPSQGWRRKEIKKVTCVISREVEIDEAVRVKAGCWGLAQG
jgi:hypothetical protein